MLTTFALLCNRSLELFHVVKLKLCTHWTTPLFPFSQTSGSDNSTLFLCIWLLQIPYMSGIIQHLSFCDWLISRSTISLRFIHVVAHVRISFLKRLIFYCVCIHHIFFIHSSINGYLVSSTSSLLWIVLLWTWVCKPFGDIAFNSFGYTPRSGIAGSYGNSIFNFFRGTSILFSTVAAPIYIPTNSARGFQILHILSNTCEGPGCPSPAEEAHTAQIHEAKFRVTRDLEQGKGLEIPGHGSSICLIPNPNLPDGEYSPWRQISRWLDCLAREGGLGWLAIVSSNKRHLGVLVAREAQNPPGTKSKWGLTVASLKLPRHNDFQGLGSFHTGGYAGSGDWPERAPQTWEALRAQGQLAECVLGMLGPPRSG